MGVLDGLALTLADLQSDSAEVAARVAEDFAFLKAQVSELTAQVAALTADTVAIEALQALALEVDATINAIEDIPNPVVEEPPVV